MPRIAFFFALPLCVACCWAAAPKPLHAQKEDSAVSTANPAADAVLRDKTLVVWVAPANLEQRGGSALTLDDDASHFDGVVFGEIAPRRWMAGSDLFRRSARDQTDRAEETAVSGALVRLAIIYQGPTTSIYRDGALYARQENDAPPPAFGPESVVMMGPRHLLQGDTARFAGEIAEARIYDRALSAEEVECLTLGAASDPSPWAWWSFEDGPEEKTGRFGAVSLVGGARVEDGRLVLDGETGALYAARDAERLAESVPETVLPFFSSDDIQTARRLEEHLASDPHRPGYHFVVPQGRAMPFDPNGAIFWKGRYHLFYIFQENGDHHWGHVSSVDLFHWRRHPTGLLGGMFSGNCFLNKDGRPTMCYHQVGQGNAAAVALDDALDAWEKLDTNPITPKTEPGDPHHGRYESWDPHAWVEGETYYAIFGGRRPAVAKATRLEGPWTYAGDLMANGVEGVALDEDVSCPDLFRLGDRWMLLCISHRLGCRYYLGEWKDEQFHPDFHEPMSWTDNQFFAPESLLDDQGRRIMWAWIFDGVARPPRDHGWSGTLSLPRVLTLDDAGRLRMNPPDEIERLRYDAQERRGLRVEDGELPLEGVEGASLEILVELRADGAGRYGLDVLRAPDGTERTRILYDAEARELRIDTTASNRRGVHTGVESAPFEIPAGEALRLRVFVDKSVVEVFANDGLRAISRRVYPLNAASTGVALFATGGGVSAPSFQAWRLAAANPF